MMQASIYGRLGADPQERTTKSGKPMTTARVAVEVGKDAEDPQTLWCDILAFGRSAAELAGMTKGDMVGAIGRLTRGTWTAKDGTEREQWSLLADGLMATRAPVADRSEEAAPYRAARPHDERAAYGASARFQAPPSLPFDDDVPF